MKKYRIGLLVGNKTFGYSQELRLGVQRAMEEKEQSLIAIADLLPYHTSRNAQENLSIAFEIAAKMDLDCYIMPVGIIDAYTAGQQYQSEYFAHILPKEKTLILENKLPGYRCITKDNVTGMRECMRYLIENRGFQKIGFISGAANSRGAKIRENVFYEEMERAHLTVAPEQFARGDFTGLCADVIEKMLDDNPDIEAIACSCDEIAFTTYQVLRKRGLVPGKDVAVTGFDDLPRAERCEPPLSTVNMTAERLGYEAGLEAIRMCEGLPQVTSEITSHFIVRSSCGEEWQKDEKIKKQDESIRRMYEARRNEIYALKRREWTTLQIVDDALRESNDPKLFYRQMLDDFSQLGARNADFLLFPEALKYTPGERFVIDRTAILQGMIRNQEVILPEGEEEFIRLSQILSHMASDGNYSNLYSVGALMANHELLGIMVIESDSLDDDGQMMALIMIGYALKHMQMIRNEKEMIALLNSHNVALQNQSSHDEMTGLLNRRGYMNDVKEKVLQANGGFGAVMFLDLDGLKTINDTYGHEEGDVAIRTTAQLLRKCLRDNDVLARFGGDEFVAFLILQDEGFLEEIIERIRRQFVTYNEENKPPYELSISVGSNTFAINEDTAAQFPSYLAMADELLYEEKRHKKQSRRK